MTYFNEKGQLISKVKITKTRLGGNITYAGEYLSLPRAFEQELGELVSCNRYSSNSDIMKIWEFMHKYGMSFVRYLGGDLQPMFD